MCADCEEVEATFSVRLACLQGVCTCLELALRSINEVDQKLILLHMREYETSIKKELMDPLRAIRAYVDIEVDYLTAKQKVIPIYHESPELSEADRGRRAEAV